MNAKHSSKNPSLEASSEADDLLCDLEELDFLALAAEPLKTSVQLRENVLGTVSESDGPTGYVNRLATFFDIDVDSSRTLLAETRDVHRDEWTNDEYVTGVRVRTIDGGPRVAGAVCSILHMPAGSRYPEHRHLGDEWCFFLGGNGLEAGHEWNPGDLILNPAGSHHAVLAATSPEPFILAAVVYEGIEVGERSRSK